jgi:hypothetical protein
MRKIRNLETLRSSKTQIGYFGGHNMYELLQKGDMLLVFETIDSLESYCEVQNLPKSGFIQPMYFEEMVEGMSLGGHYGLTKGVCRLFDKEWRSKIGDSPVTPSAYASVTDFLRISGA